MGLANPFPDSARETTATAKQPQAQPQGKHIKKRQPSTLPISLPTLPYPTLPYPTLPTYLPIYRIVWEGHLFLKLYLIKATSHWKCIGRPTTAVGNVFVNCCSGHVSAIWLEPTHMKLVLNDLGNLVLQEEVERRN